MNKILIVLMAVCLSACACVPGNTEDPETFVYNGKPVFVGYDSERLDEMDAWAIVEYDDEALPSPPAYWITLHPREVYDERADNDFMMRWAYTHELVHVMLLELGRPDLSGDEELVDRMALAIILMQETHQIQGFTE